MSGNRRRHYDLQIWQISMNLVEEIYDLTRSFPDSEKFGLSSQMQRAAVSIPSNIAEGAARSGTKEFLHFLSIARGSLCELETQLMICERLAYTLENTTAMKTANKLFAQLSALISSLKSKVKNS